MTKKTIVIWTSAVVFGILIGILLRSYLNNKLYIFGSFFTLVFFIYLTAGVVLGLIIDLTIKSKMPIVSTVTAILLVCTATLTSVVAKNISGQYSIKLSDKIIKDLYVYRHTHGQFPENIDSLKTNRSDINRFKKTQAYFLDKKDSTFSIYAWNDGWYYHVYYSKDSSWQQRE